GWLSICRCPAGSRCSTASASPSRAMPNPDPLSPMTPSTRRCPAPGPMPTPANRCGSCASADTSGGQPPSGGAAAVTRLSLSGGLSHEAVLASTHDKEAEMKRLVIVTLSVLGVLLVAAGCKPALTPTTFEVVLNGSNEVPPNASTAVGSANVTVAGNRLAIDGAWDGFDVVDPGAHVHGPAAAGVNAGILFELSVDYASRTFEGTFTLNADQMAYFLAGELYINLHSAAFPGGEIRGQILP